MTRTLVAALGSPHGDDQIGWRLVDRIAGTARGTFDVVAISSPIDLLERLAGVDRLIVVDACRTGGEPGTITRLVWPDSRIEARHQASTHSVSLPEVLRLTETLGRLPASVILLGVEIADSRPALDLSPAVKKSLNELAQIVLQEATTDSRREGPMLEGVTLEEPES